MKTITAIFLTLFSLAAFVEPTFATHEDPCDHHVRDTSPSPWISDHCNHR